MVIGQHGNCLLGKLRSHSSQLPKLRSPSSLFKGDRTTVWDQ
ncbi:hypothetical protein [Nostoc sp.]